MIFGNKEHIRKLKKQALEEVSVIKKRCKIPLANDEQLKQYHIKNKLYHKQEKQRKKEEARELTASKKRLKLVLKMYPNVQAFKSAGATPGLRTVILKAAYSSYRKKHTKNLYYNGKYVLESELDEIYDSRHPKNYQLATNVSYLHIVENVILKYICNDFHYIKGR